jgi:hypothetical protein
MKRLREILKEDTDAAGTLHPKSRPYDEMGGNANVDATLDIYQRLNQNQKVRHRELVQDVLQSSWRKKGGGINDPENAATKNRKSVLSKEQREAMDEEEREAMDYFTAMRGEARAKYLAMLQNEELRKSLECFGFSSENQQRVEELFNNRVQETVKNKLGQLLQENSPSPFVSNKQLDVIEILAEKIQELEEAIADTEQNSQELREEIRHKEATAEQARKLQRTQRVPKRSTVAEYLEEVDPDSTLMREEKYVDPRMREYLRFFPRY